MNRTGFYNHGAKRNIPTSSTGVWLHEDDALGGANMGCQRCGFQWQTAIPSRNAKRKRGYHLCPECGGHRAENGGK